MKGEICLCPESIRWIKRHLLKSAKAKFSKMIKVGSIKKLKAKKTKKKTKRKTKKIVGKIYYTKNDQPYKILKSGKARFLKK